MCSYVPEEVVIAAGVHPWHAVGSFETRLSKATVYRSVNLDSHYTGVLESILAGELDFLDAVICSNRDDDQRGLHGVVQSLGKFRLVYCLATPHTETPPTLRYFAGQIAQFTAALESLGGQKVTTESLRQAIHLCNETRRLLRAVYELRKRRRPTLLGSEVLSIVAAARVMAKRQFNEELGQLLPYLEERRAPLPYERPRCLITGSNLDDLRYVRLVEEVGIVVAMDDLDGGARYCWADCALSEEDIMTSLAKRYLSLPDDARQASWERQLARLINWVSEFNVDGVIDLPILCSFPREMRTPFLTKNLEEAGIFFLRVERDYQYAQSGQLRNRFEAFREMLSR